MRRLLLVFALCAAFAAPAAAAAAPPATPEAWRAAAAEDLAAIHDILRDNSPAMVVERDSGHFRAWLEGGLRQARADLPKVRDGRGYFYVVHSYAAGFRDGHIAAWPRDDAAIDLDPIAWPGFVLGWKPDGYEVAFRDPGATQAPPLHAQLVSCDGRSAEALAADHDRYDGDFTLASGRRRGARSILLDEGDPLVVRPRACRFRVGGETRTWRLDWRPLDAPKATEIETALKRPKGRLAIAPWDGHGWWVTVPSLSGDQDWNGFYAQVAAHLDAVRAAGILVVDLRGDTGGNSAFADRLAKLLWGEALVAARRPDLGPTVWRASRLNRDDWAQRARDVATNPNFTPEQVAEMRRILARFDDALARGEPVFEDDDAPPSRPPAGVDPMRGRVVLLTDYACGSACLDLMDEFLAMPGVVQAGGGTSADTIFMDLTIVPALPSGLSEFVFGHKAWIRRPRGSNVAYEPTARLTWTGAPSDETGLRAWLAAVATSP